MRIREENCNMVLLAAVGLMSVAIAGSISLLGPADKNPVRIADRSPAPSGQAPADKRIIYISDQPPVRVVGSPFVPNTNPRER